VRVPELELIWDTDLDRFSSNSLANFPSDRDPHRPPHLLIPISSMFGVTQGHSRSAAHPWRDGLVIGLGAAMEGLATDGVRTATTAAIPIQGSDGVTLAKPLLEKGKAAEQLVAGGEWIVKTRQASGESDGASAPNCCGIRRSGD
jgi:hypothetical protein